MTTVAADRSEWNPARPLATSNDRIRNLSSDFSPPGTNADHPARLPGSEQVIHNPTAFNGVTGGRNGNRCKRRYQYPASKALAVPSLDVINHALVAMKDAGLGQIGMAPEQIGGDHIGNSGDRILLAVDRRWPTRHRNAAIATTDEAGMPYPPLDIKNASRFGVIAATQ